MTACKLKFSSYSICFSFSCFDEQDHLIWSIFERRHKRFNSDTTHTAKCSSSVTSWSPCRTQTETQGGNGGEVRKTRSPSGPRTICPFHKPADWRGGNTPLQYKQKPAYFKVACKSRLLQADSSRYCEVALIWIWNDCIVLGRITLALQAAAGFDWLFSQNKMTLRLKNPLIILSLAPHLR